MKPVTIAMNVPSVSNGDGEIFSWQVTAAPPASTRHASNRLRMLLLPLIRANLTGTFVSTAGSGLPFVGVRLNVTVPSGFVVYPVTFPRLVSAGFTPSQP